MVLGPDHRLLAVLRRCGARPGAAGAARALSLAGEHGALWTAAGLTGAATDPARRGAWLRATALVAASHAVSMGVKRAVRRPRPVLADPPLVRTAGRHGFPSSHAASSTAAAFAFGTLLPRAPLAPLAAAVCVSRLVAGVHYPTDVAVGALLGAATARLGRDWALGGPTAAAGAGARLARGTGGTWFACGAGRAWMACGTAGTWLATRRAGGSAGRDGAGLALRLPVGARPGAGRLRRTGAGRRGGGGPVRLPVGLVRSSARSLRAGAAGPGFAGAVRLPGGVLRGSAGVRHGRRGRGRRPARGGAR